MDSNAKKVIFAFALIIPLLAAARIAGQPALPTPFPSPGVTVLRFTGGMSFPRGLKWGPDGNLYVAESGPGGNISTIGQCEQVPGPPQTDGPGPWTGGNNGRISRIDPQGNRTTFSANFPSSFSAATGSQLGVADVAFFQGYLYALGSGGGCSHGHANPNEDNLIYKIFPDGSRERFVNISDFVKNFPTLISEPEDFEPDGTPYSMVATENFLYVVEANHGQVIRIDANGNMSRLVDLSAVALDHIVPTASTFFRGNLYVGNLNTFPVRPGSSKLWRISPNGDTQTVLGGLTTVLGVQFSSTGNLYILEMNAAPGFPAPGNGRIIRIDQFGNVDEIVSRLTFPTAMAFGPDGNLYVSHIGFGIPAGEILKLIPPAGLPF